MANTDISQLEKLLQNIANAKLNKHDLKRFGDKNMIKLFKVGQLTTEYLLTAQGHSEGVLQAAEQEYAQQYEACKMLEDKVKDRQRQMISLKQDLKVKKQTLKTFEAMLRQPEGLPVEVFKCKVCFKYFASDSYLVSHYKKRHSEYYLKEIRQREDEQIEREMGEIDKHASD